MTVHVIVSHKQEKIILSIESLNNGPEIYALTDEVDISNDPSEFFLMLTPR